MSNSIDKLNMFSANVNSPAKIQPQKDSKGKEQKKVDLSMLPDGVSTYEIDGDEITIYKRGGEIQTQVVGRKVTDINLIHEKVRDYVEKQQ